ncbi:MAG: glycoside hydrolase family 13 protein [Erysipelotrichaceae bacterium]
MEQTWWKEAVGYQIYPRSFKDSNNDGVGDLPGIISKLDYLHDLGVNVLWISPFYQSPMDDNGYDVSDYSQVDPLFGTMEDAESLIAKAHEKGMKVILDLVLNQTSDEHPWFQAAKSSKDNPYRDYYIWQDPKWDEQGNALPPNNWASFFGGSCWELDPTTNQYYMKIFSKKMPDLNWANPKLRQAMYGVADWWLAKGVDGFRMDAIAHLAKDTSYADSTMELHDGFAPDWGRFSNRKELYDYIHEFHDQVLSKYDTMTVGEVGGGAQPEDSLLYAGYDAKGFNMVFNFDHCWKNGAFGSEDKRDDELVVDVLDLKQTFKRWYDATKGKAWLPQYWLNHDHPRVMSQYGNAKDFHKASGKMLATALYCMPGTPFIYNGEEIGMTNVDYTDLAEFKDVWVKNHIEANKETLDVERFLIHLRRTSRDNARTPMQWDATTYAGFSEHEPAMKVIGNYEYINVASQLDDEDSILHYYRKVIALRKAQKDVLVYGDYELFDANNPDVYAYVRTMGTTSVLVVCNFRAHEVTLSQEFTSKAVWLQNYNHAPSMTLAPFEAFVVELA